MTWCIDVQRAWTYKAAGMKGQVVLDISDRPVPQEPMYIICVSPYSSLSSYLVVGVNSIELIYRRNDHC
jgi:hypothetical protein